MSLLTDSKAAAAFKLSQRRAHTHNNRQFFNESFESSYVVLAQDIWASKIPEDPQTAITSGLVAPVTLRLYNILSPDASPVTNAYKAVFFWSDQTPSTQSLLNGKINPRTKTLFSDATYNGSLNNFSNGAEGTDVNGGARIGHIVPEIINIADTNESSPAAGGYRPILRNKDTTRIYPLDAADWFLDTFSGIVVQETDGSILNLNGSGNNADAVPHAELECYIYVGDFVSDVVGLSGGSSISQTDLNNLQSLLEAQIDSNTTLIAPITANISTIQSNIIDISSQLSSLDSASSTQLNAISGILRNNIEATQTNVDALSGELKTDLNILDGRVTTNENDISTIQTQTDEISANFADLRIENAFQENTTFIKDVTIQGSLNIAASAFSVVTANQVATSGAFVIINDGETGAGVTNGTAGIRIDRGIEADAQVIFDENSDQFKVGISGSENFVATRTEEIVTAKQLVIGDTNNNFTQTSNVTFDGSTLEVTGDINTQSISATSISVGGDNVITQTTLDNEISSINTSIFNISGQLEANFQDDLATVESTIDSVSGFLDNKIDNLETNLTTLIANTSGAGGSGDVTFAQLLAVSADLQTQIEDINTSIVGAASGVIGVAEDGDYTDGLFTDFTPSTAIGTAVDRFNELFLAIAPSPPPELDNISISIGGENGKISYGTDNTITGYRTGSLTKNTSVTNIIVNTTSFSGTLNDDIASTSSYVADAFGNAKTGTLQLLIDGVVIDTVDLTSTDASIDSTSGGTQSGFNLSAVSFAELNGTPISADIFAYRTGNIIVKQTDFNSGENFGYHTIQVIHSEATSSSNIVDMNIDSDVTTLAFAGQALGNFNSSGTKYISGINYNTGGTVDFTGGTVDNAYRNSYSTDSNGISWIGTNVVSDSIALPQLGGGEGEEKQLTGTDLDNANLNINASRVLNDDVSVQLQIKRPLSRTASASSVKVSNLLVDAVSESSTNLIEYFKGEKYRLRDISNVNIYGVQNDYTGGGSGGAPNAAIWDNTKSLIGSDLEINTGLLIANDRLSYPAYTTDITNITNGNFSVITNPASNPNYSSASGERVYLRYFFFGASGNVSNIALNVSSTPSLTLIDSANTLGGANEYKMELLAPGEAVTESTIQFNDCFKNLGDGNGIFDASTTVGLGGNWRAVTLGIIGVKAIVVRVTVAANFTGRFTQIQCSPSDNV